MGQIVPKTIKSKYKGVTGITTRNSNSDTIYWRAYALNTKKSMFKTEKEAAIAVDKILIEKGKEPVNILKRK